MDDLLGRIAATRDPDTVLMVISDHGFTQLPPRREPERVAARRGLPVPEGRRSDVARLVRGRRLGRTRAFSLGLTGMFINRKGREASGIVSEGAEDARRSATS